MTLSILIAAFASFTALSLAPRVRASTGWPRRAWLGAAAGALGGGIWSMHFVAMLAFSMPGMSTSYDLGLTLLSLAMALVFTGGGFVLMSQSDLRWPRMVAAGLLMGSGVVAMHYLGMAAMSMDATLTYDRTWLGASVLIAIGAAIAAVWLASLDHKLSHRLASAMVMGAAIAGMHYAGMRAAVFTASRHVDLADGKASVSQTVLAAGVSALTILILLLGLGAARLDRAFQAHARREARIALRLRVADILRERDTADALQTIAALMGEHFGVTRTGYGQLDPSEEVFEYDVCWTREHAPPLLGRYPAADFGAKIVAQLKTGRTVAIEDLLTDELSDEDETRATARAVNTRAILVVPFVRDGHLQTIVYLNDQHPRHWHQEDVLFMEELAERTRLVIERAAVEDQLRDLNATLEARVEARTVELRQAEEARIAVDTLYRAFFENTPEPLFVIGVEADGSFTAEQVNPAHEASVGFKQQEVQGKRIEDLLPPPAAQRVLQAYRHVVDTGEIYQYRDVFELAAGPQHWDTCIVPLWENGRIVRLLGSSRDITRQVLAEEALRQSQKLEAIGSLTGGVAHDFNNLLTPILGALDMLQRKGVGGAREQRLIEGALASAERAKSLVHRLLAFARRQPLKIEAVSIPDLLAGMIELVTSTVGPKIMVQTDVPLALPLAKADANQLEMAVLNLSVNARDAMPDGGTLRIEAVAEHIGTDQGSSLAPGSYVRITVADSGEGMDAQTQRRAIEPFFSTKGIGKGTGLGLSMVHGLAAQLGGALTIHSELGVGTWISLWVPTSDEEQAAARPLGLAGSSGDFAGPALLVDDDELAREATATMLSDLGFCVTQAPCAEHALRLLEDGLSVGLLVTDHLMPGMSGAELCAEVRRRDPNMQVLVISGYAETDAIPPTLPLLVKPFRSAALAQRLAEL